LISIDIIGLNWFDYPYSIIVVGRPVENRVTKLEGLGVMFRAGLANIGCSILC